jgi:hypothetical protein
LPFKIVLRTKQNRSYFREYLHQVLTLTPPRSGVYSLIITSGYFEEDVLNAHSGGGLHLAAQLRTSCIGGTLYVVGDDRYETIPPIGNSNHRWAWSFHKFIADLRTAIDPTTIFEPRVKSNSNATWHAKIVVRSSRKGSRGCINWKQ